MRLRRYFPNLFAVVFFVFSLENAGAMVVSDSFDRTELERTYRLLERQDVLLAIRSASLDQLQSGREQAVAQAQVMLG